MEAIRIVHAAASMLLVMLLLLMMIIISSASASAELTEEEAPSSPSSATTTAAVASVSVPLHRSLHLYTMEFHIGDTKLSGIVDTASDLIWTNNFQWLFDADTVSYPPGDNGGCYGRLCTFQHKYNGDTVIVRGVMGKANKLAFGGGGGSAAISSVVNYHNTPDDGLVIDIGSAFDCKHDLPSSSDDHHVTDVKSVCKAYERGGIVGLNRDKLSLVSQLKLHSFSYCLPHHVHEGATGQIKFNDDTTTKTGMEKLDGMTKLELDKHTYPASGRQYVAGLKRIVVGNDDKDHTVENVKAGKCSKDKDPDHRSSGDDVDGPMIIDSGATFTALPAEVFNGVRKLVEDLIKQNLPEGQVLVQVKDKDDGGLSCYQGESYPGGMKSIVLEFIDIISRDKTKMEIPPENYFLQREKDKKYCLAITPVTGCNSILGAYQQQDTYMLFDIDHDQSRNSLYFTKRKACGGGQSQSQEEENHAN